MLARARAWSGCPDGIKSLEPNIWLAGKDFREVGKVVRYTLFDSIIRTIFYFILHALYDLSFSIDITLYS